MIGTEVKTFKKGVQVPESAVKQVISLFIFTILICTGTVFAALEQISPLRDVTAAEGSTVRINLSEYFRNTEGGEFFFYAVSDNEAVTVSGTDELRIRSTNSNWYGSCIISVYADELMSGSALDSFTVTFYNTNEPPYANYTIDYTTIPEDSVFQFSIEGMFSDSDGIVTSVEVESSKPEVRIERDGNTITLIPTVNWHGSSTIIITATDDSSAACMQTFNLIVLSVNDPPVLLLDLKSAECFNASFFDINLTDAVHDVDHDFSKLVFSGVSNKPVSVIQTDSGVVINPGSCMDTAEITLIVTDPDGASDSAGIKLFTNIGVPYGTDFPIIPRQLNVNSNRVSYTLLTDGNNHLIQFYMLGDSLFVKKINRYGQRVIPDILLTCGEHHRQIIDSLSETVDMDNPDAYFTCESAGSFFFISYELSRLKYFFVVDSQMNIVAQRYMNDFNSVRYFNAVSNNETLTVFGMESKELGLCDIYTGLCGIMFDPGLNITGKLVLDSGSNYASYKSVIPKSESFLIITEKNPPDSPGTDALWYRQCLINEFTYDGRSLMATRELVPYKNDDPEHKQNYVSLAKLIPHPSGYLLLYTKSDVTGTANSHNSSLYAAILDNHLNWITERILISQGGSMDRRDIRSCIYYKKRYRIDWYTGYVGMGDPSFAAAQIFDESITPISSLTEYQSHGLWGKPIVPQYMPFNDSLIYGTTMDTLNGIWCRFETLESFFSGAPTVGQVTAAKQAETKSQQFIQNGNLYFVNTPPDLAVKIFDILGRQRVLLNPVPLGCHILSLRHLPQGTYVMTMSDGQSKTTRKFILPGGSLKN